MSNPSSKKAKIIKRRIIQIILALLILAGNSLSIKYYFDNKTTPNLVTEVEAETKILEKEIYPSKTINSLENYLKNMSGEYGYSVIDLTDNKVYGARQDNKYFMASTYKIAVSCYLYNQIALGKINPDKKLINQEKFFEEGTGILQYEKAGQSYEISYLNKLMIKKSDNIAANILLNYLGTANIQNFLYSSEIYNMNIMKNTTTPLAMSLLLQKIYNNEIISQESKDELIKLMVNSITDSRLVSGIPESTVVAHKIGTYGKTINDVGIVYLNQRPYVISVYSKKTNRQDLAEIIIAEISHQVFEFEKSVE